MSSYSEYKVKNGLSCSGRFRNLGRNGPCYYIAFDELTDIRMYMPVAEYTSGRKDFILEPRLGEGGQQVFNSLQGGNRKFLKLLRGDRCF